MKKLSNFAFYFLSILGIGTISCTNLQSKGITIRNRTGTYIFQENRVKCYNQSGSFEGIYQANKYDPKPGDSVYLYEEGGKKIVLVRKKVGLKGGMPQTTEVRVRVLLQKIKSSTVYTSAIEGCINLETKQAQVKSLETKIYSLADKINNSTGSQDQALSQLEGYINKHNNLIEYTSRISKEEQEKINEIEKIYKSAIEKKDISLITTGLSNCERLKSIIVRSRLENQLKELSKNLGDNKIIEQINRLGYFGVTINETNVEIALESVKEAISISSLLQDQKTRINIQDKLLKHKISLENLLKQVKENKKIERDNKIIREINRLGYFGVNITNENSFEACKSIKRAIKLLYSISDNTRREDIRRKLEDHLKKIKDCFGIDDEKGFSSDEMEMCYAGDELKNLQEFKPLELLESILLDIIETELIFILIPEAGLLSLSCKGIKYTLYETFGSKKFVKIISPLTRDFIKIGMVSYYGDTGRMRNELLKELKYKNYKEGIHTL